MIFPEVLSTDLILDERLLDETYRKSLKRVVDKKYFSGNNALQLAEDLIGKILVRNHRDGIMAGRITETEAYMGLSDDACHAYGGKVTQRNSTLYMEGGTAYVHMIYGMYFCFNITANREGIPEGVLIRGVKPLYNLPLIAQLRYRKENLKLNDLTGPKIKRISDGPGKLTLAFDIGKEHNRSDIKSSDEIMIYTDGIKYFSETSPRIGINYADSCKDKPWRFTALI